MCSPVTGHVVEDPFGQISFPADAVHDLQLERTAEITAADRVDREGEVLDRFPVETETVQCPEHERRVPDPGVPVVPVAYTAGRFRQGGGRGRHDGASG